MTVHKASRRFWSFYEALSRDIRTQAEKQFGEEVWSARITLNYRALAYKRDFGFVWVWIGEHKVYDDLVS